MVPVVGARLLPKDPITRAARAVAFRIPALCHEAFEHAMEIQVVVEALLNEADKVSNGLGSFVLKQLQHDDALRRGELDAREVIGLGLSLASLLLLFPKLPILFHQRLKLLARV